jgi:hypothetical protein
MKGNSRDRREREQSKREEFFDLLQFLRVAQYLEQGEEPDFILDLNGIRLGVEHTRVLRDENKKGSLLKAKERWREEIMQSAHKLYRSSTHQSLYVTAIFDDLIKLKKCDIETVAAQLCLAVQEVEQQGRISKQFLPLEPWSANYHLRNHIPQAIAHLWLQKGSNGDELWSVSDGGAIGPLPADTIQFRIDDKEKRVASYRQRCDQLWLLIVVSGNEFSSMFDDEDKTFPEITYKSSFNKVFLLNSFRNQVTQLHIVAPDNN